MNLQEKTSEAWKRWSPELLIFALLLGFGFWINRGVELKGLYMDDLYLWSCYGDQSFTEYVFPMGSSRFRFLFILAGTFLYRGTCGMDGSVQHHPERGDRVQHLSDGSVIQ